MADEQEPRNKLGQTYDEWVQEQQLGNVESFLNADPVPWDIVIGSDKVKNIRGVKLSDMGAIVGRVTRPISPTISGYAQQAAGQYGTTFQGVSYGEKNFQIPLTIMATSKEELNDRMRDLANVTVSPEMKKGTSIVFGEEPDIVYYGYFSAISDPVPLNETAWDHSVNLTFTANDPRGFFNSEDEEVDLSSGEVEFTPKGTGYTDPIITITPKPGAKPLTRFGYTINDDENEKVMVGTSADTQYMFDPKPVVFNDKMTSMNQWELMKPTETGPNSNLPFELGRNGTLTDGDIHVNPAWGASAITNMGLDNQQASWTSRPDKMNIGNFYGPLAISKTNMASSIGDGRYWEAKIRLHNIHRYSRATQGLELYFLDKNNKRRARFAIRNEPNGQSSYSALRFGQNWDEEVKSVKTGLGYAMNTGRKEDFKNKKDVTVSVPTNRVVITQQPYTTHRQKKQYNYYAFKNLDRYHYWWHTWETTTYNPKTKKYSTSITWSRIGQSIIKKYQKVAWHDDRLTPSKKNDFSMITDWAKMGQLQVASKSYWKKGQQRYVHNNPDEGKTKGKYPDNKATKRWIVHNTTDIVVTQYFYNRYGQTETNTTNLKYYNGNGHRSNHGGKMYYDNFGVLGSMNTKHDVSTQKGGNNQFVDYNDRGEAGTYDDVFAQLTIGYDEKGMYWAVDDVREDGNAKNRSLIPKTYDKRPDLHQGYNFTLDKIAIHMFKQVLPEDDNVWKEGDDTLEGDVKYRPAKKYRDNYLSFYDMTVTKILKKPDNIDIITLKPGQEAVFNTENNVFTIDGNRRQDLISVDSTFPQLRGGVPNKIKITPDPGDDHIIKLSYRPTIL